jgi:hypothetical protein
MNFKLHHETLVLGREAEAEAFGFKRIGPMLGSGHGPNSGEAHHGLEFYQA